MKQVDAKIGSFFRELSRLITTGKSDDESNTWIPPTALINTSYWPTAIRSFDFNTDSNSCNRSNETPMHRLWGGRNCELYLLSSDWNYFLLCTGDLYLYRQCSCSIQNHSHGATLLKHCVVFRWFCGQKWRIQIRFLFPYFKSPSSLLQSFHSLSFQTNQAHDWDQIGSSRFVWFECVSRNLLPNTTPCLLSVPMFGDPPNRLFLLHVLSETLKYSEFLRVLEDAMHRNGPEESIRRQWELLGARLSGWSRWPKQRSLMAAYHRMELGTTCW